VTIHIAHSPDSDDAFMFYGLASGKVPTGGLELVHVLSDIETLNRAAFEGKYEISAVSFHAYAHLTDKYILLPHGASMGDNYGPIVVTREGHSRRSPEGPEAGLLIHEGQLTYEQEGLRKIVDLGEWWAERTGGLPLPLGGNIIRRDLGPELISRLSRLLHDSIAYGLDHREEAVTHAMQYGRGLDRKDTDTFVGMYVNDLTLDYGDRGRTAVLRLLGEAAEKRLIPPVDVVFAE
jgi:1,4-dihydroxy-6-naphthoate synthase